MKKVAVFSSGNGSNFENLVISLRKTTNQTCCIALMVTDNEHSMTIQRSHNLGIPYLFINPRYYNEKESYEREILEQLKKYSIDIIALAGYMRYIGNVLLTAYPNAILNIHPSLLPNFPGKSGILNAFESGETETGVTVHLVDHGVDTGPILGQKSLQINGSWSLSDLERKVHLLEYQLYPEILLDFCKVNTNEITGG